MIDLQISLHLHLRPRPRQPRPTRPHPRPRLRGPPPPLPRQLPDTDTNTDNDIDIDNDNDTARALPANTLIFAPFEPCCAPLETRSCCPLVLSLGLKCKRCSYRNRDPARPLRISSADHSALPTT